MSLSASATQPSTFGGWMGACTGVGACNVTMNSSQSVTASFVPPPQMISLPFPWAPTSHRWRLMIAPPIRIRRPQQSLVDERGDAHLQGKCPVGGDGPPADW